MQTNRETNMRTWRTYLRPLLALSLAAAINVSASAASPKTDAAKVADAMSAAPAALSRNASVAEMNENGSMKELRQGTNGWTCVPDDPAPQAMIPCASTRMRWNGCTRT